MEEILGFLRRLHDHNDREWFDAHRDEWTRAKRRFAAFTERLIAGIAAFDPSVRGLRPQDCTYRIARDTRFSADKTPYKTHVGAFVAPRGKKSGFAGYYLHLEPSCDGMLGGSLLAAGLYCPEPHVLRSVREEILDHGDELTRAIGRADGFRLDTSESLKRIPSGFAAGSEYAELLKLKDFYIEKPLGCVPSDADALLEYAVGEFRRTQPFVAQLNRAVTFAYEEMR